MIRWVVGLYGNIISFAYLGGFMGFGDVWVFAVYCNLIVLLYFNLYLKLKWLVRCLDFLWGVVVRFVVCSFRACGYGTWVYGVSLLILV